MFFLEPIVKFDDGISWNKSFVYLGMYKSWTNDWTIFNKDIEKLQKMNIGISNKIVNVDRAYWNRNRRDFFIEKYNTLINYPKKSNTNKYKHDHYKDTPIHMLFDINVNDVYKYRWNIECTFGQLFKNYHGINKLLNKSSARYEHLIYLRLLFNNNE
jgi:hypothetical protein